MKKTAFIFSLGVALVLLLTSGCGPKLPAGMPKLYPVTLTFTCNGKPLDDAHISAFPAGISFNWPIGGVTDAEGKATLMTSGQYPGAPEGELKICVQKVRVVQGPTYSTPEPTTYAETLARVDAIEREREEFLVAGKEYNEQGTTPLSITVKKGKNAQTFDIPEDGTQIKFAK